VSARLDEETHATLQLYATFLGNATHDYIIKVSHYMMNLFDAREAPTT
jgi:hypothetical protein